VQNGDQIFAIQFNGWDGTAVTTASSITGLVGSTGTIGAGAIPGKLAFTVRNAAGATVTPMAIDETATTNFAGTTIHQNANAVLKSASAVQASKIMDFQRTRGSVEVPVTVNSNDHVYTLRWQAYDGSAYTTATQIRSEAEGTISSGIVPGRMRFMVADDTGSVGSAVISQNNISSADSNSNLKLSGAGTGTVELDVPTQTTVGAAGGADALPANPTTYFKINVGGTDFVIPAFAVS
jgi:hypothetical protein